MMTSASVVICTYNDDVEMVRSCVRSILRQTDVLFELLIIDSSKDGKIESFSQSLPENVQYIHVPPKGLSYARNEGVKAAKYSIVAFTDPDCIVEKGWLKEIVIPFDLYDDIAISGGKILPLWHRKPPLLFRSEYAKFSLSTLDLGGEPRFLRDEEMIVGANFAIDKEKIKNDGLFSTRVGRRGSILLSGEETEICARVRKHGYKVYYTPRAIVYHRIKAERLNYKWMMKRVYWGGITRSILGRKILLSKKEIGNALLNPYDIMYVVLFSLPYLLGYLHGKSKFARCL